MVAQDLREQIHAQVERLPERQLADVLRLMELLALTADSPDVESEEMWLLASGTLKQLVDGIDEGQQPLEDWRGYLSGLDLSVAG